MRRFPLPYSPYTLSSCPLFNPTFSTAEVLEAQAASTSTTTSDVDERSPAQSASSTTKSPIPSYGLAESMRKAASPPAASTGIELDDSSPFQYIDFSIAPTDAGTPDSASPWETNANFEGQAQSTKESRTGASSSAFGMDPPLNLGNSQAQSPRLGDAAMPLRARRGSILDTAQTPRGLSSLVLDSFEPLNPALSADSYTFPAPPVTSPTTRTVQELGPQQQLPQPPYQRQRQISAGSGPGLNESPPVGLGPPDLRVAYELAGMAYKSRNPQSPSYPAGMSLPPIAANAVVPNSNGYPSSLPPPPLPVAGLVATSDQRPGFPRAMSSYESQSSTGPASLPMTASTSADSNASNPAAAIAEAEGHKHVTPFISSE